MLTVIPVKALAEEAYAKTNHAYEKGALNDDDKEAPINPRIEKSKGLLGFAVVKGTMTLEKNGHCGG